MATHDHQHLPPSPIPSPPRRRPKKKHADPFLDLSTPLPSPSPPSPPSSPRKEPQDSEEPQESLVTRIILTPILFMSFLLSLFLINRSNRARRRQNRPALSSLSYFWPAAWIDPEPYQDPDDTTWDRHGPTTHYEPHTALNPSQSGSQQDGGKDKKKRRSWHLQKKILKIAKLEISDAFEMRGRVIVLLVAVMVLFVVGVFLAGWWVMQRMWWGRR